MSGLSRRLTVPMKDLLRVSAGALARQKLARALSVLGVVIGVGAVMAMWSVSEGARREVLAQIERLGLDNILVRSQPVPRAASRTAARGLTVADSERLLRLIPQATIAAPAVLRFLPVSGPSASRLATVTGVTAGYQTILTVHVRSGRLLGPLDEGTSRCVIGGSLAGQLFGGASPLGQRIQIASTWFTVVGVVADRATTLQPPSGDAVADPGEGIVVPLSSLLRRPASVDPDQQVDQIWLQTRDGRRAIQTGDLVTQTLLRLHDGMRDFAVLVPRALLDQRLRTQRIFNVVVGSVAALSLLVSGIGIMNIMLASVVARTHEIGIRRTAGATRRWIVLQFLVESVMMTFGGGVVGLLAGAVVSRSVTAFAGWPTVISFPGTLGALAISIMVGLVFGIYPAMRAARLEPIDAVRYE
jgi:putative ABC transport system permease protein